MLRVRLLVALVASVLLLGLTAGQGAAATEPTTYSVSGEVVDQAGRPVEYADVSIVEDGYAMIVAVTDHAGRFTVRHRNPGTYRVRVHRSARFTGHGPFVTVQVTDHDVEDVRLTVTRNGNIVARTVDPSGAPLPAVPVVAYRGETYYGWTWNDYDHWSGERTPEQQRMRDSYHVVSQLKDGRYDVKAVGYDTFRHTAKVSHSRVTVSNGTSPLVTVTLTPVKTAVFTGRVLGANGKPLARAPIQAFSHRDPDDFGGPNHCRTDRTRTDADGRYTARCINGITTPKIAVHDKTWKHVARVIRPRGRVGATTTVPTVKLQRAVTVKAKITDSKGKKLKYGPYLHAKIKRGKKFVPIHRVLPTHGWAFKGSAQTLKGLPAGTYRFCYAEGESGPNMHRQKCKKKTYKLKAGKTYRLPTVRLKR